MVRAGLIALPLVALPLVALAPATAPADETSAADRLGILYSTRLTFTDDGLPLVTVEIMGGQRRVELRAPGGVVVRPDGAGGPAIEADGGGAWTITAEAARPAVIRDWTIVETLAPDDAAGIAAALARWRARGQAPRPFEVGTVFGTGGEVIDTREVRIAIDPAPAGQGAARAAAHARRFGVPAQVHEELVRRPAGTIVARSGGAVVRNADVLWFAPRRPGEAITVADVPVGGGGARPATGVEDRRYWGAVYVTIDRDGALLAANAVPEDRLLAGLVPAEMYPEAPPEALAAQAIAARTELLQKIGRRNLADPFLLCSTQQCQVYAGAGREDPRTTRAVERTRGIVLLRDGGDLVDARYSASCGGHGEDNDAIWGGAPDPALRGRRDAPEGAPGRDGGRGGGRGDAPVTDSTLGAFLDGGGDAWCARGPLPALAQSRFRWTERVRADELAARVGAEHPGLGRITALVPRRRGVSGRVGALEIQGERGAALVTGDLPIRRLLGGLRSTLFEVRRDGDAFVFRGAGFGHGVGMCQLGAIGMAGAGKTHAQILAHYYRGAHLRRLY